jgi:peroxiredoxin
MNRIILTAFLLIQVTFQAQDYPFLSASTKKIQSSVYIDFLNKNSTKIDSIQKATNHFLEDGTIYDKKIADSIFKTKNGYLYTTIMYRDTIKNQFSYVLYKRTKEEVRKSNQDFNKYMKADEKNRSKLKNTILEELTLTDINDEVHSLEKLKGKIIVVDFWFVNCGSCIKEMPDLNKLKEEFETEEIAWFGITYDAKEKVESFLKRVKFDYTIVPDSKHLTDRFDIRFYPTTLIIDANKRVVYSGKFGDMKGRVTEIRAELLKLLPSKKYKLDVGPAVKMGEEK